MRERGWLLKQFDKTAEEVKSWPTWMQDELAEAREARKSSTGKSSVEVRRGAGEHGKHANSSREES